MRKLLAGIGTLTALLLAGTANAQSTVKVGVIMSFSGQFADAAAQMDNGIKLYVKQHGDTVAGKKIEIIRKDTGGIAPDVAKRLAQELIVRDKADILAGFTLTPNALAAADVSAEAKKFMVVMNAATSIITTKSPYMARTSVTTPMLNETLGQWAFKSGGIKKAYTMVSDYGPGQDAEEGFTRGFKDAGGEIIGSVRFPVANPDFAAFVQRGKDLNPDGLYIWVPGGAQPAAVGKALAERGVDLKKTKVIGQDALTDDSALKSMGDASIGIITVANYDYTHDSAMNKDYVKQFNAEYGRNPDFFSVGAYDGMALIYEALKKTGGKADGDSLIAAAKGTKWESPRGPMAIDPDTRDVVENVYIRRVEKVDGHLQNVEFDKVENVKDPVKARMKN
ncbi:MAG: branched-chain amino acid transporter periplasmic protein [Rhodospirillales bacterium]|nr:branched-chain amino acid transporter periplasmic protein [Rhodospirillales bacterium]